MCCTEKIVWTKIISNTVEHYYHLDSEKNAIHILLCTYILIKKIDNFVVINGRM